MMYSRKLLGSGRLTELSLQFILGHYILGLDKKFINAIKICHCATWQLLKGVSEKVCWPFRRGGGGGGGGGAGLVRVKTGPGVTSSLKASWCNYREPSKCSLDGVS